MPDWDHSLRLRVCASFRATAPCPPQLSLTPEQSGLRLFLISFARHMHRRGLFSHHPLRLQHLLRIDRCRSSPTYYLQCGNEVLRKNSCVLSAVSWVPSQLCWSSQDVVCVEGVCVAGSYVVGRAALDMLRGGDFGGNGEYSSPLRKRKKKKKIKMKEIYEP
jgi:hypothetical protein